MLLEAPREGILPDNFGQYHFVAVCVTGISGGFLHECQTGDPLNDPFWQSGRLNVPVWIVVEFSVQA